MLIDVIKVDARDGHWLLLEFENGERRRFDMAPYLHEKPWVRIKSESLFQRAFVENGTVAWPGNIDIAPETLYDLSVPVETCPQ
jgi:hypothetical protein